jgi:hypothetical protein
VLGSVMARTGVVGVALARAMPCGTVAETWRRWRRLRRSRGHGSVSGRLLSSRWVQVRRERARGGLGRRRAAMHWRVQGVSGARPGTFWASWARSIPACVAIFSDIGEARLVQ